MYYQEKIDENGNTVMVKLDKMPGAAKVDWDQVDKNIKRYKSTVERAVYVNVLVERMKDLAEPFLEDAESCDEVHIMVLWDVCELMGFTEGEKARVFGRGWYTEIERHLSSPCVVQVGNIDELETFLDLVG